MGRPNTLVFVVPDEYLKAALALLDPMLHSEVWAILKAEADHRRHKPARKIRIPRHAFDELPAALQSLLRGHS